jgi:sterol desaturase/sphingolipid hydroxylase (fatty acid hydroxylase superfamily)
MDALADLLSWKLAVVAAWFAALLALERLIPDAPPSGEGLRARVGRRARNGALFALNAGLSPLFVLPVSVWAASADIRIAAVDVGWRPEWAAGWAGLALDLLLLDLFIYWWHRANHEVQALWRFHEVHHLDARMDATTAVRFHVGEVAMSALARACVIVAAEIPLTSVLVFETLVLLSSLFHHADIRLPPRLERALAWVVVVPSHHRVHHHAVRADTDSNYATLLSVWDRVFGSRRPWLPPGGVRFGVEGREDLPLPRLLGRPFAGHPAETRGRPADGG